MIPSPGDGAAGVSIDLLQDADSIAASAAAMMIEILFMTLSSSLPDFLGVATERVAEIHAARLRAAAADDPLQGHRHNLRERRLILCLVCHN